MKQSISIMLLLLGPFLGSFLNCMAMRMERNEDFVHGHSHCMNCGHILTARDLVPVASWIRLRGNCRYCGKKISLRYPVTELLFTVLYLGVYVRFDLTAELLRNLVLTGCLFTLSVIDIDSYRIPDACLGVGLLAWLLAEPFLFAGWRECLGFVLSGMVCGGCLLAFSLLCDAVMKKESLGGGDIKLFALLGLYLGGWKSYFLVLLSSILGLLFAGLRRLCSKEERIPFGPCIAAAGYLLLLFGTELTEWYISLVL